MPYLNTWPGDPSRLSAAIGYLNTCGSPGPLHLISSDFYYLQCLKQLFENEIYFGKHFFEEGLPVASGVEYQVFTFIHFRSFKKCCLPRSSWITERLLEKFLSFSLFMQKMYEDILNSYIFILLVLFLRKNSTVYVFNRVKKCSGSCISKT